MYGKLFSSMYEGTMYGHWQAIVTFQQMLVLCNQDGVLDMTPEALSGKTSIPLEIIKAGLEYLEKPDPHSRTPGEDGRRIVLIDAHRNWGWSIVNHRKYQLLLTAEQKREADRQRIAEKRRNDNKISDVAESRDVSQKVANVAHVYADVYADIDKSLLPGSPAKPASKKKSLLPADFKVYAEMAEWAHAHGFSDQQIDSETEKFKAHHGAKGTLMLNWEMAWHTWMLNAISYGLPVKPPAAKPSPQLPLNGNGHGNWWDSDERATAKGLEIGITRDNKETQSKFFGRIKKELDRRKAAQ